MTTGSHTVGSGMFGLLNIARTISICCHYIQVIMLFVSARCLAAKFEGQRGMIFAEQVQFSN